jgi:AcrR family transcriptional regulator
LEYLSLNRTIPAKRQQKEQTRARLVEAALRVFALQGYDHATVDEISLAAGHSKGAYYFHFDSKEGIFLELLSTWTAEQTRRLHTFEDASIPPAIALLETLQSLLRYDDRDPQWLSLLPEFWAQGHRNDKVHQLLQKAYDQWLRLLTYAFEKAESARLISLAVRPEAAASLVLALHDGLVVHRRLRLAASRPPTLPQTLGVLISVLTTSAEQRPTAEISPPVARRTVRRTH